MLIGKKLFLLVNTGKSSAAQMDNAEDYRPVTRKNVLMLEYLSAITNVLKEKLLTHLTYVIASLLKKGTLCSASLSNQRMQLLNQNHKTTSTSILTHLEVDLKASGINLFNILRLLSQQQTVSQRVILMTMNKLSLITKQTVLKMII